MSNPLQGLQQQARSAFYWQSMNPDKRGQGVVDSYGAELLEDIEQIKAAAEKHQQEPGPAITRYTALYKRYISSWLNSESRCASTFVTGGSNFPVRQQQKRHAWAENKYTEFREWRTRVLNKICKSFAPKTTPLTELEKAKADLKERQQMQQDYHKINTAYRAYKKKPESLESADLSEGAKNLIREYAKEPDYHGQPIARFQFSNNNANIKRLEQRVKILESKAVKHEAKQENEVTINGVRILQNWSEDRVQIFFDGKPAQEIIDALKRRGWHWSPFNKCWQRKNTNDATYSAKEIAGKVKVN